MKTTKQQRGVALMAALMVLLIISIIGVAAMRSSAFSAKVATGVQLDAIAFEAAESAIAETLFSISAFNDAQSNDDFDEIVDLFNGGTVVWCITEGGKTNAACADTARFDSRGVVQAESRAASTGYSATSGNQISSAGGGGVLIADFELTIQGNSTLVGYGLSNRHVQQALRRGMVPGSEIQ
jgi:type IV pilus assembly protein PilX